MPTIEEIAKQISSGRVFTLVDADAKKWVLADRIVR